MEREMEKKWPSEENMEELPSDEGGIGEREESATAEVTSDGRYKCRTCGRVFDTLEEHDEHHRKMHEQRREQNGLLKQRIEEIHSLIKISLSCFLSNFSTRNIDIELDELSFEEHAPQHLLSSSGRNGMFL